MKGLLRVVGEVVALVVLISAALLVLGRPAAGVEPAPRIATYNVQVGHPVGPHVAMILHDARRWRLDVLALEEDRDYGAALAARAPAAGYRLIGRTDNALLVRAGAHVDRVGRLVDRVPYLDGGGRMRRSAVVLHARVDGVTYAVLHPVVHAWLAHPGGRRFDGPPDRRASYCAMMHDLATWSTGVVGPLVLAGDWNADPTDRGPCSPAQLRDRIGGRFARPGASTGHGEIDFAIVRGLCRWCVVRAHPGGRSDHRLVTIRPASTRPARLSRKAVASACRPFWHSRPWSAENVTFAPPLTWENSRIARTAPPWGGWLSEGGTALYGPFTAV